MSPDSSWGRRTREGQGLGAQGGAAAGTAVRPSASLRPPRAASRGLGSGASGARSPRVRRHGLPRRNGAQGAGGSLVLSGPRPRSFPGPRTAPGSPTPDGKFGAGLDGGRCYEIGFPCRGPRPRARSAGEAGCPGKPGSGAAPPSPRLERSPCSCWGAVRGPPLGVGKGGGRAAGTPHPSTHLHSRGCPFPPPWEEQCRQSLGARCGVRPGPGVRNRGKAGGVLGG